MSAKNDGVPAFPVVPQHDDMSLRDFGNRSGGDWRKRKAMK